MTDSPAPQALAAYVAARRAEAGSIEPARRAALDQLAGLIGERLALGELGLTFVCTHNSRRSQLAQVWGQLAADACGIEGLRAHSAGTEVTAFHPNAVASLRRAGFAVEALDGSDNPRLRVRGAPLTTELVCHSKTLAGVAWNEPQRMAVMTCSSADRACPSVPGVRDRLALTFRDPKEFDGTPLEQEAYDERCAQIARELLHVFAQVSP